MSGTNEEEESKEEMPEIKLSNFEKVVEKNTCLYSTYEPDHILA
jgi:hypothetical protein